MAQNQASNRPTSIIDSKSLSNFDRKPPMNADAVGRPLGHYKSLHHRVIIPRTSAVREGKEEGRAGWGGARRGEAVPCLTNWYLMPDKCGTWCPTNTDIENVTPLQPLSSIEWRNMYLSLNLSSPQTWRTVYPGNAWYTVSPRSRKFPLIPTHKRRSSERQRACCRLW